MKSYTRKPTHIAALAASLSAVSFLTSAHAKITESYQYDAAGNIVEKTVNGVTTKMDYDKGNRITSLHTGETQSSFRYDAASRPIATETAAGSNSRTEYGYGDKVLAQSADGKSTSFYYNAEGFLVGKRSADKPLHTYTYAGNVLAADGTQVFTNEAHLCGGVPVLAGNDVVTSDHLGSTLALGEKTITATAYGEGLESARYTGKPYIPELGTYAFQYRNYSPTTNRWTTPDPSGFPDGLNNLIYVENKPNTSIDPRGLAIWISQHTSQPPVYSTPGYSGEKINLIGSGLHELVTVEIQRYNTDPPHLECYDPKPAVTGVRGAEIGVGCNVSKTESTTWGAKVSYKGVDVDLTYTETIEAAAASGLIMSGPTWDPMYYWQGEGGLWKCYEIATPLSILRNSDGDEIEREEGTPQTSADFIGSTAGAWFNQYE